MECYLFLTTDLGKTKAVTETLRSLRMPEGFELIEAIQITGPYDIIARLKGPTEELADFLTSEIGGIEGIMLPTMTCPITGRTEG